MKSDVRNKLLLLGALWGLLLAVLPAVVMADRLTGLLAAALAFAVLSGAAGALVAGRWAARRRATGKSGAGYSLLSGFKVGAVQGLVGGAVVALLFWTMMAVTISGFTLRDPVEASVLMSPRVFLGSFFVALSAFVYALVGGIALGPLFGPLVERTAARNAGKTRGKEEPVVR